MSAMKAPGRAQTTTLKEYIGIAAGTAGPSMPPEIVERERLPLRNLDLLKARGLHLHRDGHHRSSPRAPLKLHRARRRNLSPAEIERAVRVASIIRLAERTSSAIPTKRYGLAPLSQQSPR